MSLPEQNPSSAPERLSKKLIKGAVVALPILLLTSGWLVMRSKHTTQSMEHPMLPGSSQANSPTSQTAMANHIAGNAGAMNGSNETNVPSKDTLTQNAKHDLHDELSPSAKTPSGQVVGTPGETANIPSCFSITFKHKQMASHSSDDECSHHRNLIKLTRMDANPATVCIRVNGTPVRHEKVTGTTDQFVIGAVAGPNDTVIARFCTGKAKCNEACPYPKQEVVKKDEFLEAIGGSEGDGDPSLAQWEATDGEKNAEVNKAVDGELKKELEEQENPSLRTAANNSRLQIFKDWISGSETPACDSKSALQARSARNETTGRNPASVQ